MKIKPKKSKVDSEIYLDERGCFYVPGIFFGRVHTSYWYIKSLKLSVLKEWQKAILDHKESATYYQLKCLKEIQELLEEINEITKVKK